MYPCFAHDQTDLQPFAAVKQQRLATRMSQVHLISSVPSQWQHPLQLALALHSQSQTAAATTAFSSATVTAAAAVESVAAGGKESNSLQLYDQQQQQQQQQAHRKQQQQQQYVRTQLPSAQQPLSPPVWTALNSPNTPEAASSAAASAVQAPVGELLPIDVLQMAKSGGTNEHYLCRATYVTICLTPASMQHAWCLYDAYYCTAVLLSLQSEGLQLYGIYMLCLCRSYIMVAAAPEC
jgi:hypothetical protein